MSIHLHLQGDYDSDLTGSCRMFPAAEITLGNRDFRHARPELIALLEEVSNRTGHPLSLMKVVPPAPEKKVFIMQIMGRKECSQNIPLNAEWNRILRIHQELSSGHLQLRGIRSPRSRLLEEFYETYQPESRPLDASEQINPGAVPMTHIHPASGELTGYPVPVVSDTSTSATELEASTVTPASTVFGASEPLPTSETQLTTAVPWATPSEAPPTTSAEDPETPTTEAPTFTSSEASTITPAGAPTSTSTEASTIPPTEAPTTSSTEYPTTSSTEAPTTTSTENPTAAPTEAPTASPDEIPLFRLTEDATIHPGAQVPTSMIPPTAPTTTGVASADREAELLTVVKTEDFEMSRIDSDHPETLTASGSGASVAMPLFFIIVLLAAASAVAVFTLGRARSIHRKTFVIGNAYPEEINDIVVLGNDDI
ncbi:mucin-5AC [Galendromus occidentalis]|uniref:Mucin-5AC n=1 Tax=Galendromus occidentalis TaxID=34638 RepID=A0AAJ7PAI5_9ACAR|nr:mucin-5AC [Galendromus occidentalis]